MNDQIKNIFHAEICKRTVLLSLLLIAGIFYLLCLWHFNNQGDDYFNRKDLEAILGKYELIKKTEISDHLYEVLVEIVNDRKKCFLSQVSYSARTNTCRKDYINRIFNFARDNIKATPMKGLFMRCLQECPIYGSLCNGEEETAEQECVETEARCVEYCLDQNWRGGNFHDEDMTLYNKMND